MTLAEIGLEIRRNREERGLTQARLATAAGITRTTLNQLENGVVTDLGIRKVQAVLAALELTLVTQKQIATRNFVRLATTAVNVAFKSALKDDELRRALSTGKVPAGRRPHFRVLFEEVPAAIRRGVYREMSVAMPLGKLERNLARIATDLELAESASKWATKG